MVAACVLDPENRKVFGVNEAVNDDTRRHAERVAMDRYVDQYGEIPEGSIILTTLSPCNEDDTHMADERYGESCTDLVNASRVRKVYCGYMDPSQHNEHEEYTLEETANSDIKNLCKKFADTFLKKSLNESQQFTSMQQVKDYFKRIGKSEAQAAAAWSSGYRGPKTKEIKPYDPAKNKNLWYNKDVDEGGQNNNQAQAFIDQVYGQYPDWPYGQADKVMVWGEGEDQQFAAFKLKPGTGANTVEIDWIMAGPEQRKGVGSRAIQELQRQAQAAGIRLTLYPWSRGQISQAALTRLYRRNGFKPIAKGAKPMAWDPVAENFANGKRHKK
jgi:pyrimidine deaminase RibD-like protein/GNAT superfamily N-acetyltransferase